MSRENQVMETKKKSRNVLTSGRSAGRAPCSAALQVAVTAEVLNAHRSSHRWTISRRARVGFPVS